MPTAIGLVLDDASAMVDTCRRTRIRKHRRGLFAFRRLFSSANWPCPEAMKALGQSYAGRCTPPLDHALRTTPPVRTDRCQRSPIVGLRQDLRFTGCGGKVPHRAAVNGLWRDIPGRELDISEQGDQTGEVRRDHAGLLRMSLQPPQQSKNGVSPIPRQTPTNVGRSHRRPKHTSILRRVSRPWVPPRTATVD